MKLLFCLVLWPMVAAAATPCSACHLRQTQSHNAMRQAMETTAQCDILRTNPRLTFKDAPYSYRLERAGNETYYTVEDAEGQVKVKVLWALGQGAAGQTYIYESHGKLYESRVSYFKSLKGLDLTMGAQSARPANLEEAAGRVMTGKDAAECIGCHATNAVEYGSLNLRTLVPGVQCDRCHEVSATHSSKPAQTAVPAKLGALSTEDLSNFCGQCHRTWAQIAADGPRNINNVRFQPYRLANSKCYDATDARIRCTACHDPHSGVSTTLSAYDAKCQACHANVQGPSARLCNVGTKDCVTCHMPKYDLPGAHHAFTDHWIRTVKLNAPYPN